jgi:hypothetical protein
LKKYYVQLAIVVAAAKAVEPVEDLGPGFGQTLNILGDKL